MIVSYWCRIPYYFLIIIIKTFATIDDLLMKNLQDGGYKGIGNDWAADHR